MPLGQPLHDLVWRCYGRITGKRERCSDAGNVPVQSFEIARCADICVGIMFSFAL